LLIAAVAHANSLSLYTRNPQDFLGLEALITIVALAPDPSPRGRGEHEGGMSSG
jgi:hypothetical protein